MHAAFNFSNLDERTREVYQENLQMANALALHFENEEMLKKSTGKLEMSNRQLVAEKELNEQLVKEKISQSRKQKKLIKELQVRHWDTSVALWQNSGLNEKLQLYHIWPLSVSSHSPIIAC